MLIIIDHKIPDPAKQQLSAWGEIMELETQGITYDAISGHPDIFFCRTPGGLVIAPNTPGQYIERLKLRKVVFQVGEKKVDKQYPGSAAFNAVIAENYCIHNTAITDPAILRAASSCQMISVNQGYTRCNLLPLRDGHFITSDPGISKLLRKNNLDVCLVDPEGIILPGFRHGFFGGACGVFGNKVFIIGSLAHYRDGKAVGAYLNKLAYQVIELYDGPLFDGGSIMFQKCLISHQIQ